MDEQSLIAISWASKAAGTVVIRSKRAVVLGTILNTAQAVVDAMHEPEVLNRFYQSRLFLGCYIVIDPHQSTMRWHTLKLARIHLLL